MKSSRETSIAIVSLTVGYPPPPHTLLLMHYFQFFNERAGVLITVYYF